MTETVLRACAGYGANIVSLDQYSDDSEGGDFFQRTRNGNHTIVFA